MSDAISVTMDRAGRIVIPKPLRDVARLEPGAPLLIRAFDDGRIEIEPAPSPVQLVAEGPLLIAEPSGPYEPLSIDTINDLIRDDRRRGGPK